MQSAVGAPKCPSISRCWNATQSRAHRLACKDNFDDDSQRRSRTAPFCTCRSYTSCAEETNRACSHQSWEGANDTRRAVTRCGRTYQLAEPTARLPAASLPSLWRERTREAQYYSCMATRSMDQPSFGRFQGRARLLLNQPARETRPDPPRCGALPPCVAPSSSLARSLARAATAVVARDVHVQTTCRTHAPAVSHPSWLTALVLPRLRTRC